MTNPGFLQKFENSSSFCILLYMQFKIHFNDTINLSDFFYYLWSNTLDRAFWTIFRNWLWKIYDCYHGIILKFSKKNVNDNRISNATAQKLQKR